MLPDYITLEGAGTAEEIHTARKEFMVKYYNAPKRLLLTRDQWLNLLSAASVADHVLITYAASGDTYCCGIRVEVL